MNITSKMRVVAVILMLLHNTIISTAETDVVALRAVRGRAAKLPCGQGKVFLDGPSAYVSWLKNDRDFLYRFPDEGDQHKDSNAWQELGCSSGGDGCEDDTSFRIKHVTDSDQGVYRCRVHYQGSPSQDYVIDVSVIDTPGLPKIFNEANEEITKSYIGPFGLGSDFTLICEVDNIYDADLKKETLVYWRRNSETLEPLMSTNGNTVRAMITAHNITRDELNAHYECVAQNADVTDPLIRSVVIKMYLPPISVEIRLNNNINFEAGQPRLVDCVVLGCVPPPAVTWHLDQQLMRPTSHKEVHDGNYTVSSLSLSPAIGRLTRTLRCRAHNPHLPKHVYQDSISIKVGYRPVCANGITVLAKPERNGTQEPSETVQCQVESLPEPIQFIWTLPDSRTLVTAVSRVDNRPHLYTSTLTWIPKLDEFGTLTCRAYNMIGEQKKPCEYAMSIRGLPQTPDCMLKTHAEGFYIHCQQDWDESNPQNICLEILNEEGDLVYKDENSIGTFQLATLTEFTGNLSVRLYAVNEKGASSAVRMVFNNKVLSIRETPKHLNVMYGFIVTCVGTVTVLTVIFTTLRVYKNRREPIPAPDIVPSPDGSFHREPELERIETTSQFKDVVTCQDRYTATPVFCRVRLGRNGHQPNCSQSQIPTIKHTYYV